MPATETAGVVPAATPAPGPALLEVCDLEKRYGAIQALRGVGVRFAAGAVHGLVGANGAGKSTLVRILAGLEQPDAGRVELDGVPVRLRGPGDAEQLGLSFIHQELNLVAPFSAVQNVLLGRHGGGLMRPRRFSGIPARVREVADRLEVDFDLQAPAGTLTVHQQWLVSIMRALVDDCRLIAMDEPTAALDDHEARRLRGTARDLARDGVGVLFVSHRLEEVTELCEEVTVFRDGAVVSRLRGDAVTRAAIVEGIVGGSGGVTGKTARAGVKPATPGTPRLSVQGLRSGRAVRNVHLGVAAGEIVGVAGLVGSGRSETAQALFGLRPRDGGTVLLDGRPFAPRSPREAMRRGVAYVPEERRAQALMLDRSVRDNLQLATLERFRLHRLLPLLDPRPSRAEAAATSARMAVKAASTEAPVRTLSGGNQQKVVMGRWLDRRPRVLILDEPTRGVDVGAREGIYAHVRAAAAAGVAVVVISSDFEELLVCSRVTVLARGRTVGELAGEDVTVAGLLHLAYTDDEGAGR